MRPPRRVGHGFENDQDVKIGSNCWIGTRSIILKGVEIGDYFVGEDHPNCLLYLCYENMYRGYQLLDEDLCIVHSTHQKTFLSFGIQSSS